MTRPSTLRWPSASLRAEPARIGELAVALGYPSGGALTATLGMVTRVGPEPMSGSLSEQTLIVSDALIDRGNSGWALIDAHGELLGINVAASARGLTYTIPADHAQHALRTLREPAAPAHLGAVVASIVGIDDNPRRRGVGVRHVTAGGPAANAGLTTGDIITALNGHRTESTRDLADALRTTPPGQPAELTVNRDHADVPLSLLPGRAPESDDLVLQDDIVTTPGPFTAVGWTTGDVLEHPDQPLVILTRGQHRLYAIRRPQR